MAKDLTEKQKREILREFEDEREVEGKLWKSYHTEWKEHYRFANAKDGQWTTERKQAMGEPCLQENRVRAFLNNIINTAVKQEVGCNIEPVSEGATAKLAKVRQAQEMKIWDLGRGKQAFALALRHECAGGYGVIRYRVGFSDDNSFNKKITFEAIKDPTKFSCDAAAKAPALADMKRAILEWDLSLRDYQNMFGEWDSYGDRDAWEKGDRKKVFEYWRIVSDKDSLISAKDGKDYKATELAKLQAENPATAPQLDENPTTRPISKPRVEQIIIANGKVHKVIPQPGIRLPFKVLEGFEYLENDQSSYQPLTLDAEAPQVKLNFIESQKALIYSKAPTEIIYVPQSGYDQAIKDKINSVAREGGKGIVMIPYKDVDDQGRTIAPPTTRPPFLGDPTLIEEGRITIDAIEACMGLTRSAWMARPQNTSGVAIHASEEQGETNSFNFIDSGLIALEELFVDILHVIPTLGISMQVKLAGDDQREETIWINNALAAAKQGVENHDLDEDEVYSLTLKVSPAAKSMRDKAHEKTMEWLKMNPFMAPVVTDLTARQTFDGITADAIVDRANRFVAHNTPWALASTSDPRIMAMTQALQEKDKQMAGMQNAMAQHITDATKKADAATARLQALSADKSNEAKRIEYQKQIDDEKLTIDKFKALTDRIKADAVAGIIVPSPNANLSAETSQGVEGAVNPAQP